MVCALVCSKVQGDTGFMKKVVLFLECPELDALRKQMDIELDALKERHTFVQAQMKKILEKRDAMNEKYWKDIRKLAAEVTGNPDYNITQGDKGISLHLGEDGLYAYNREEAKMNFLMEKLPGALVESLIKDT